MYSFTASEARAQLGVIINKAMRDPVSITKNGSPKVVVMLVEDFNAYEQLKIKHLRVMVAESIAQSERGEVHTIDDVFSELTAEELRQAGE